MNSTQKFMCLPNPLPDIYRSNSVDSAVNNYIRTLSRELKKNPSDLKLQLMLNACRDYLSLTSSKKITSRNRKYFNAIHQYTVKNHKDTFVKTIARTKSWISFFYKCIIKLQKNISLDSIRDIYACRTILDSTEGKDTEDLIKKCYEVMDENIKYFIKLGFTPCDSEPLKDTEGFDAEKYPDLIVPERSYLSPENIPYVKDYIRYPKANSYQSLHVILKDTYGIYFEYQVRTYSMDINAEVGASSHVTYKDQQKKKRLIPKLEIERSKINMHGYRCGSNNTLLADDAGIEKSVSVLHRTYRVNS